jgi:hypothetical protein
MSLTIPTPAAEEESSMSTPIGPAPSAADLRAAIARADLPIYIAAALAGMHPNRLSAYLGGRAPITAEIGQRVLRAVSEIEG